MVGGARVRGQRICVCAGARVRGQRAGVCAVHHGNYITFTQSSVRHVFFPPPFPAHTACVAQNTYGSRDYAQLILRRDKQADKCREKKQGKGSGTVQVHNKPNKLLKNRTINKQPIAKTV